MCFASTGVRDLTSQWPALNIEASEMQQGSLGLFGDPFLSKVNDQREMRTVSITEELGEENLLGIGGTDINPEAFVDDLMGGHLSWTGTDKSL